MAASLELLPATTSKGFVASTVGKQGIALQPTPDGTVRILMLDGAGGCQWVELDDEDRDLLAGRLAEMILRDTLPAAGPPRLRIVGGTDG